MLILNVKIYVITYILQINCNESKSTNNVFILKDIKGLKTLEIYYIM